MKIPTISFLAFVLLLPASAQEKQKFVNKTAEITIEDLGKWTLVKGGDSVVEGKTLLKLSIPEENLHAQFQFFEIKPAFDVLEPEISEQIKSGLNQGDMEVVASGPADFLGKKALRIYAIKPVAQEGKDDIVHVLSISTFFGNKFLALSISDDDPDLSANANIRHLFSQLTILAK